MSDTPLPSETKGINNIKLFMENVEKYIFFKYYNELFIANIEWSSTKINFLELTRQSKRIKEKFDLTSR